MDPLQVTYFTADYLAYVARNATKPSKEASPWKPLVAVVFSAMMLEAAVNEILFVVDTASEPMPDRVRHLKTLARVTRLAGRDSSLTTRVQTIATVLSDEPMAEDRQPYQDFDLLIAARNHLVHHRPEQATRANDTSEWQVSNLVRRLTSRGFKPTHPSVEAGCH